MINQEPRLGSLTIASESLNFSDIVKKCSDYGQLFFERVEMGEGFRNLCAFNTMKKEPAVLMVMVVNTCWYLEKGQGDPLICDDCMYEIYQGSD